MYDSSNTLTAVTYSDIEYQVSNLLHSTTYVDVLSVIIYVFLVVLAIVHFHTTGKRDRELERYIKSVVCLLGPIGRLISVVLRVIRSVIKSRRDRAS